MALDKGVDRRDFMKLMGASVAMAGLAACKQPAESIVPYVRQPENTIPGQPLFFATAMTLGGYATGVLAESHTGRPTKIEGNPDHPSSLGGSDAFMQASVLGLYDPDRSQVVRHMGDVSTWSDFIAALQPVLKNPAGIRLLTQTITSPSLGAQIQALLAANPAIKWHQWEPVSRDNVREGARLAFGSYVHPVYHFDKANVVVSLGSDFMGSGPGHLRYARDFMSRRRVRKGMTSMNRLYAFESMPTSTGTSADHRWPVRSSQMESIARELSSASPSQSHIAAIARDLKANAGSSIVIAGDEQPPVVHAIAHAINQALGNHGTTITLTESPELMPVNQLESLRALVTDMNAGAVQALIILGGNPVFDTPADFKFVEAFQKVPFRAHLSPYYDETSELVHWHIPETHYLETWGDGRGHDGTVSIQQPLIAPLYNGRHASEVLGALLGGLDQSPYDVVKAYWFSKGFNDLTWRKALHDGMIPNFAMPASSAAAANPTTQQPNNPTTGLELEFKPDPTIYDGRFANNGWLQELPKPQTKITWDNVLIVSPKTADALKITPGDALVNERTTKLAEVSYRGRKMKLPVWVMPGQADDVLTVFFGYGRSRAGKTADGVGFNTYALRDSDALHIATGVQIAGVDETYRVACTQEHQSLNVKETGGDRGIIRSATFAEYQKNPDFAKKKKRAKTSRCGPRTNTTATRGAWSSTPRSAPAATAASSPASRRTTSPSSARSKC